MVLFLRTFASSGSQSWMLPESMSEPPHPPPRDTHSRVTRRNPLPGAMQFDLHWPPGPDNGLQGPHVRGSANML
jgi:hypothetical protein